jgi:hypothetical protein
MHPSVALPHADARPWGYNASLEDWHRFVGASAEPDRARVHSTAERADRKFGLLMTARHGLGSTRITAAAAVAVLMSGDAIATQPPRGAGANWDYGTIAEGYTSAFLGGPVDGAHRMFSAPDFGDICAAARADTVKSLRAVPRVDARVGEPIPYAQLEVDALDLHGVLVRRVPIAIESDMRSEVLDTRQDHIGDDYVRPKKSGTIRLRIRTICKAPGREVFVTVHVTR